MIPQDALLAHMVSRMQADINFLVSQNIISPADGELMQSKLPGQQAPGMPTPVASPSPAMVKRDVPMPPARKVSQAPQARALWAYNENRQEAGDLSFSAGENIEILEETNADWWKGQNSRGETGLFPSNYVEKVSGNTQFQPPPNGGRMVAPIPEKGYSPMPVAPPEPAAPQQEQGAPPKKNKFGKYGGTMAQSAAGGVGFGAGAAIGGGLIHAIF